MIAPDLNESVRTHYDERERRHWTELERLVADAGLTLRDVLKHYPAFIQRRDLPRLLAHYELFKLIVDLPGSIIELGVFRGAGLFTWANLLETFCPGDRSRKVFGFDHFAGYKYAAEDGKAQAWTERAIGKLNPDLALAERLVNLHNEDNLLPGVERCRIIDGDISETVPTFARNAQGMRLAMLYFDVNLHQPTLIGLKHLYPLVTPGGVVAFNGYGAPPWAGEAQAIEEYFASLPEQPVMRKFPFSPYPSAYFIKGGGGPMAGSGADAPA